MRDIKDEDKNLILYMHEKIDLSWLGKIKYKNEEIKPEVKHEKEIKLGDSLTPKSEMSQEQLDEKIDKRNNR